MKQAEACWKVTRERDKGQVSPKQPALAGFVLVGTELDSVPARKFLSVMCEGKGGVSRKLSVLLRFPDSPFHRFLVSPTPRFPVSPLHRFSVFPQFTVPSSFKAYEP